MAKIQEAARHWGVLAAKDACPHLGMVLRKSWAVQSRNRYNKVFFLLAPTATTTMRLITLPQLSNHSESLWRSFKAPRGWMRPWVRTKCKLECCLWSEGTGRLSINLLQRSAYTGFQSKLWFFWLDKNQPSLQYRRLFNSYITLGKCSLSQHEQHGDVPATNINLFKATSWTQQRLIS